MKLFVQELIQGLFPALWEGDVLLSWAVTLTVLILVVLLVNRVFRSRLSARVRYALWGVVLIRALLPVQLPMDLPVSGAQLPSLVQILEQPFSEHISDLNSPNTPIYTQVPDLPGEAVVDSSFRYLPDDPYHGQYIQHTQGGDTVVTTVPIWTRYQHYLYCWTLGVGLLAAVLLACNLRFAWKLRRSRRPFPVQNVKLPVYIAECIPSPCLFGLFRPAIYLTPEAAQLSEEPMRHILAHELTHCRHRDHLWAPLRCLALVLHWYNPLAWLAVLCSKRDGELACDEGAVRRLGEEERIPYGRTLVGLVARRSLRPGDLLSCSTAMAGGNKTIQQRIAQLVKRPETKKAALFAAAALVALAAVFTFSGTKKADDYTQFRAQIESARSLSYSPTPHASDRYAAPVVDDDLLEAARAALNPVRDVLTPVELDWADGGVQSSSTLTLTTEEGTFSYFLCTIPQDGKTYVLTPARLDAETYTPIASLDLGVTAALDELARTQAERASSITRVEYPEFKAALTQLFLGDAECVRRNETADYDMEEWLTQYTSFYEISHAAPWWLEGAEEGWYARAMDAGSWYTISIPDHLVPRVQAICEEQALSPSLDTIYATLEQTDTIYYAAMCATTSRSRIQAPEVIHRITQLLLSPQGNTAQVSDPGRVTVGEEFGVLTIPVDEECNLALCLQEVEGGCLLSCTWAESMFLADRGTLPVLWTLPAGTAQEIYTIYENWLGGQGQSAGATAHDWQGELALDALAPGEEVQAPDFVVVPAGGGGLTYHITYTRPSLTLEFGLRARDGTEYCQRVVGGALEGTIPDIPPGSYQLFVRNSDSYDFGAPGYLSGDVDYTATGALVFLVEPAPL